MVFPVIKQERLYQKIANIIMQLIIDGVFKPGDFLPSERDLSRQLGVSRASLREALIVLEISGWVDIQSGNGIQVSLKSDKNHQRTHSLADILQARHLVDCECARLAANANNKKKTDELFELVRLMTDSIENNAVSEFYSIDKKFHLAIAEASSNKMLYEFSGLLWASRVSIPYVGLEGKSSDIKTLIELNRQHEMIALAIKKGDELASLQETKQHLEYIINIID